MHRLTSFSIIALAIVLSGCAVSVGETPPAAPPKIIAAPSCPHLREYTDEELCKAAAEYDALPADAALRQQVDDYGTMRDETRICRGIPLPKEAEIDCGRFEAPAR
jgi:hypothetical protein